jgi:hypothetical protein
MQLIMLIMPLGPAISQKLSLRLRVPSELENTRRPTSAFAGKCVGKKKRLRKKRAV